MKIRDIMYIYKVIANQRTFYTKFFGVKYLDFIEVFEKMYKLEAAASRLSLGYCCGTITTEQWETKTEKLLEKVRALLPKNGKHVYVNGDARGYALKVRGEVSEKLKYKYMPGHTDWGGYYILAPELRG